MSATEIAKDIKQFAVSQGFDQVAIGPAALADGAGLALDEFLRSEWHGDMEWMATTRARRTSPSAMWSQAQSAVVLGMNYGPTVDPMSRLNHRRAGVISCYALGDDYHDVIKKRLKLVAHYMASRYNAAVKLFVDTAPLMEKPLAERAGLGWRGKHTNLVSRQYGSWLLLGAILSDMRLAEDGREQDHCGSCRACLDVCPTHAFVAPYQLDARKCISYLTIEHRGHIPRVYRAAIGNRIYGCDDCLAVCPWNKFAQTAREQKLQARADLQAPVLAELVMLDDSGFRALFRRSAVMRLKRDRFVRNVLIAIGNSGAKDLVPRVEQRLSDPSALVRAMAVWALSRLTSRDAFASLAQFHVVRETDADVRAEWSLTE